MPVPTDPFSFANDTLADALQVNARFAPLYATLDGALDESNAAVPKGLVAAYRAADTTLASGAVLVLNAEEFDVSGWFNTATGLFTPQVAGYYALSWHVRGVLSAGETWLSMLMKNTALHRTGNLATAGAVVSVSSGGSAIVVANGSTDAFNVSVEHPHATPAAVIGGAANTFLHAHLIGRS
jgi:hypothetical protein